MAADRPVTDPNDTVVGRVESLIALSVGDGDATYREKALIIARIVTGEAVDQGRCVVDYGFAQCADITR